jgi:hypothetical protein
VTPIGRKGVRSFDFAQDDNSREGAAAPQSVCRYHSYLKGYKSLENRAPSIDAMHRKPNRLLVSAIEKRVVLKFVYNGKPRTVEPQTYGISTAGKEVLRAHQQTAKGRTSETPVANLFEVAKMADLKKTRQKFDEALPAHNPHDSAMVEIFATLPLPSRRDLERLK